MFKLINGHLWRRWGNDRSGNVVVLMALVLVPIIGFIGFAADYGTALSDKARLDTASDAAAIVALKTAQSVIQGGGTTASAISQAQTAALSAFKANAGSIAFAAVPTPTISMPTPAGLTLTATVTYATTSTTNFTRVIGIPTMNIKGTSTATLTMPTYRNYYVIIDISQSMGIGSTSTDMTNLYNRSAALNLVNGGCVFACHDTSPGDPYSMETVAHSPIFGTPITLRIDAALSAIQAMITSAQTNQTNSVATGGSASLTNIGLYTMSGFATYGSTTVNMTSPPSNATTMLNTISSPTSNFITLLPIAESPASTPKSSQTPVINLGANNGTVGYGDSYFTNSLDEFNNTVLQNVTNGSGVNANSPQNYVFIITDGVSDTYSSSCFDTHCTSVLDSSLCTQMKSKATVGVIYTTYNTIYLNNNSAQGLDPRYSGLIAPIVSQIAPALQACASSSSYYFEASDGPAITTGMNQLMANSQALARISH